MTANQFITLDTLLGGAAAEKFAEAFSEVLANLDDPNTDAKAPRGIVLSFTIKPKGARREAVLSIACTTKLAKGAPIETSIFIGKVKGEYVAREPFSQVAMDFDKEDAAPAPLSLAEQARWREAGSKDDAPPADPNDGGAE